MIANCILKRVIVMQAQDRKTNLARTLAYVLIPYWLMKKPMAENALETPLSYNARSSLSRMLLAKRAFDGVSSSDAVEMLTSGRYGTVEAQFVLAAYCIRGSEDAKKAFMRMGEMLHPVAQDHLWIRLNPDDAVEVLRAGKVTAPYATCMLAKSVFVYGKALPRGEAGFTMMIADAVNDGEVPADLVKWAGRDILECYTITDPNARQILEGLPGK
ncbi:hypothetical protein COT30_00900 [Candidatus Micrarchaeota archaeon CG08_land_8_20_14_0_20_49_17]|nr:MAG: hypothetical protein COT30_00900 [Candidatus Micrarchaeota archaeon CG08_land_8_20_14_0_20_49_17]HII53250.1 hypothetical protein [Candidatus Micrarchaeota archaeon]